MKKYERPDVNVVVFECEDVIKTSGGIPTVGGGSNFTTTSDYSIDSGWF